MLKPENEAGKKMKEMMMMRRGDRLNQIVDHEINLALSHPNIKIIYVSLTPIVGNPIYDKYDENQVMVFGGNLETAAIVLRKLHDYQKFVNQSP